MQDNVDRRTFDRLVLEHLPAMHRFAIRLTGDLDRAEEVVQESLLRATRSWQTYRGEASIRTWLFQVTVNAFRDSAPKRAAPEPLPDAIVDAKAPDPSRGAEQAEQGRIVAMAVSSLPPRQREVLVLHTYEQLEIWEIAEVLKITETNVRAQLSYGRAKLKDILAPYRDMQT
jgi:RNA polymerase sigma-70 factor (ECF subfamily)